MSDGADGIGTIATGALIAHEIERAHAGEPALGHSGHEACANCGLQRVGPYCHRCGQAGHVHRDLGALVHDIAHGVFHFEGKVWRTLPLLALKPGELTRRYVHGERVKFVSPMALFLFSVFLMFAVVSNVGGKSAASTQQSVSSRLVSAEAKLQRAMRRRANAEDADEIKEADDRIASLRAQIAAFRAIKDHGVAGVGKAFVDSTAASSWAEKAPHAASESPAFRIPVVGGMLRHAAENPELVVYKMKNYAYKYSWALIPISLPFIWLLFAFRRDVGPYDHAIFAIYSLSFMSLGVIVLVLGGRLGVPSAIITLAALIVPPIHMYKQLKGAYGLGRFGAAWRTFALLIMTTITLSLFASFVFYLGSD